MHKGLGLITTAATKFLCEVLLYLSVPQFLIHKMELILSFCLVYLQCKFFGAGTVCA